MTSPDTPQTGIDYERLVEDALRSVVQKSLALAAQLGLPGETHFYISFATMHPGVEIDDALRAEHPESMTIVLQHQFADLAVADDHFSVTLFFGGKPSPMIIPFAAVASFNDPSVGFGLQFGMLDEDPESDAEAAACEDLAAVSEETVATGHAEDTNSASADIVSLDTFRKKPTK